MRIKPQAKGFTLIEVLLAMAVLAVAITGAASLSKNAADHLSLTQAYRNAAYFAHSHLNRLNDEAQLEATVPLKNQSGDYDQNTRWLLTLSPLDPQSLHPSVAGVMPTVQALQANLTVWTENDTRKLNFHMLLLAAKPKLEKQNVPQ